MTAGRGLEYRLLAKSRFPAFAVIPGAGRQGVQGVSRNPLSISAIASYNYRPALRNDKFGLPGNLMFIVHVHGI